MVKLYIYFFLFVCCISATADNNYYKILGVAQTASPDEIKQAYRKKARQWHPDRNLDNIEQATERMKEINRAYGVLKDARQRARYDDASVGRYTYSDVHTTSGSSQATGRATSRADQQANQRAKQRAQDLRDAIIENRFFRLFRILSTVKKLLDEGADPNIEDRQRLTPLFYAFMVGNLKIARLLIEHGADINFQNSRQETVLLMLAMEFYFSEFELFQRRNILKGIKFAVENGANLNTESSFTRRTPLYYSLLVGNLEIARLLMEHGADINFQNSDKEAVLFMLVKEFSSAESEKQRNNILKGIQFALENGANSNTGYGYIGRTPLVYSLLNGYLEIARLLIENGADINFKNSRQETVLFMLVKKFSVPESETQSNNIFPDFEKHRNNILKGIQFALENRAVSNAENSAGRTPLVYSLLNGNLEIARLLMEHGADINFQNSRQEAVLFMLVKEFSSTESAKQRNNILKGIEFALENGADPNAEYGILQGRALLYHVLKAGNLEIALLLMEHGANINFQNLSQETILFMLVKEFSSTESETQRNNILKGIQFALENGVDFNTGDRYGRTPLYISLYRGSEGLDIARLLMEKGADINFQNSRQETILLMLVKEFSSGKSEKQRKNILQGIEFALENGADPLIPDEFGETVSDLAKVTGYSRIRRLIKPYVKKDQETAFSRQCRQVISRLRNILR